MADFTFSNLPPVFFRSQFSAEAASRRARRWDRPQDSARADILENILEYFVLL
jgi:hypothetical protein